METLESRFELFDSPLGKITSVYLYAVVSTTGKSDGKVHTPSRVINRPKAASQLLASPSPSHKPWLGSGGRVTVAVTRRSPAHIVLAEPLL